MLANVHLHNLKITTTDTVLFSSQNEQEMFFEGKRVSALSFNGISYNGNNLIRLTGCAPFLNLSGYNYCEIELLKANQVYKTMYCFIDKFIYNNDKSYSLSVTLDYIQTYMFDIKISNCMISQRTLPVTYDNLKGNNEKYEYMSYSNTVTVPKEYYKKIYNFAKRVNISDNPSERSADLMYIVYTLQSTDEIKDCIFYNGYNTGLISVVFPCIIVYNENYISRRPYIKILDTTIYFLENGVYKEQGICSYEEFLNKYNAQIINFSIVEDVCCTENIQFVENFNSASEYDNYYIMYNKNEDKFYSILVQDITKSYTFGVKKYGENNSNMFNFIKYSNTKSIYISPVEYMNNLHCREPYTRLEIGRKGQQNSVMNFTDLKYNEFLRFDIMFNPTYPNEYRITYYAQNNKTMIFSVPPRNTNISFDKSKWEEYYIQNQASINDGLSTKHSYDLQAAQNTRDSKTISSSLNFAGNAISSFATGKVENIISGGFATLGNITETVYAYENAKLNTQKEKALLDIQWNDIKSAPNTAYNVSNNENALSLVDISLAIYQVVPYEEDRIIQYHKRYGYKINQFISGKDLPIDCYKSLITRNNFEYYGDIFDYVLYENIEITSTTIPKSACEIIKNILSNGMFFWYNYDKMYNFDDNNYGEIKKISDYFEEVK